MVAGCLPPDSFERLPVELQNRFEPPLHLCAGGDFRQTLLGQLADDFFDERFIGRAFDDLH